MGATITLYNNFRLYLLNGTINLASDTIKVALVKSTYTPDLSHDEWADVSANETTGTNYAQKTLANGVCSVSGTTAKYDADDLVWTTLTATFKYGVIYKSGTAGGKTNPLIGYILFDADGNDVVVTAENFSLPWNSAGIIRAKATA